MYGIASLVSLARNDMVARRRLPRALRALAMTWLPAGDCFATLAFLYIKAEQHHIPVPHNVFLAFAAHFAFLFGLIEAA